MAMVDSKKTKIPVNEIVTTAAKETKSPYDPDVALAVFVREIKAPNVQLLRYGNTIFVIHAGKTIKNFGTFRALNADTAANYLESSFQFVTDAYNAGYDGLITDFYDQSILNIFRAISKKPPNPDMGYSAAKLSDGGFRVTLQLGPLRKAGT